MPSYIARRILLLIPMLFGVTLVTFVIAHLAPGDPISAVYGMSEAGIDRATVERIRQELGLNDPLPVQYLRYLGRLVHGDMGLSLTTHTPVSYEISQRFPATIELAFVAVAIVLVFAIPLGIVSALKRASLLDHLCMGGALAGVSAPGFWLGIMLLLVFSLKLDLFPSGGRLPGVAGTLKSLTLPALTLGAGMMGLVTRIMRSSMLEVLGQDYMRTAYAKGLSRQTVLLRHGLKNALIPVVTVVGIQFASMLGGAVIVETVFAWPGMGRLAVNAIWVRDYPVIMGCVLVFATTFILANLIVDVFYTVLDPRIRYN